MMTQKYEKGINTQYMPKIQLAGNLLRVNFYRPSYTNQVTDQVKRLLACLGEKPVSEISIGTQE
jgi:hypothetical protein